MLQSMRFFVILTDINFYMNMQMASPKIITSNSNNLFASLSSNTNNWLTNLSFSDEDTVSPQIKKYQVYEVGEDALVLSATWKRLRDEKRSSTTRLLDGTLFKEITSTDRELAADIGDYYSKKIMMLKLKNSRPMSKYREDLNTFIHGDRSVIREEMIGLIYRLPDFYKFDKELETITSQVNKQVEVNPKITSQATFTPLKRIERKTKSQHAIQYWMREQLTGNAAMITVAAKNPLESVWNLIFDNNQDLALTYTKSTQHLYDTEYMLLSKWELTKI